MLVGILSDSHGRAGPVRRAMAVFDELGVQHMIHCGDVGGPEVFDELLARPLTFVWGNTDEVSRSLLAYVSGLGLTPPTETPTRVTLEGKAFAVFHGHEPGFASSVAHPDVDYLLHGHTHTTRDERNGRTRVINPGALHRARPKTVATLDTNTDRLTFHEIGGG
jgi:hypothetical protein